jgi:hypothetical protein
MSRTREIVVSLIFVSCLALGVAFVSGYLGDRQKHRGEIIQMQFDLLQGKDYVLNGRAMYLPSFQNRVLFPFALAAATRLGVLDANDSFILLRLVTAALALATLWWTARAISNCSPKLAAVGTLLLAFGLIFTFQFAWEHPTDFLDVVLIALMVWATVKKRPLLLLGIALVAAANRESAAFAGVLWGLSYAWDEKRRPQWNELARAFLLIVVPYAAVLLLRYAFGGARAVTTGTQMVTALSSLQNDLKILTAYVTPFNWLSLAIAMFVPPLLWVTTNWRDMTFLQHRLVYAALALVLITFFFGIVSELRIFIPSVVILILMGVWSEAVRAERNAQLAPVDIGKGI